VPRASVLEARIWDEVGLDTNTIQFILGNKAPINLADSRLTYTNQGLTYRPGSHEILGDHGLRPTSDEPGGLLAVACCEPAPVKIFASLSLTYAVSGKTVSHDGNLIKQGPGGAAQTGTDAAAVAAGRQAFLQN
jgi:hypothetical protein